MRGYFAIIADAFREALASRVLWLALGLVAIVLLALAPLGYRSVLTTSFSEDDIFSRMQLLKLLADEKAGNAGTRRIASALTPTQRDRAGAAHRGSDQPPGRSEIASWLSDLLDRPQDWYDASTWERLRSSREQKDLEAIPQADREPEEQRRLARLWIESALPGAVAARSNRSVRLTYGIWEMPFDLPLSPQSFQRIINAAILPLIINTMLGLAGVLVAILVTSPIVPQLFHSGSLPLLLSKPIRRAPLLLSVVVGATAFIVVCVTPLITGLMLIGWWRFDIWNPRLLLCIPLFLLLFLVYYSVSALAALIWRNAIVSVAVTVVFWVACFLMQAANGITEGFIEGPHIITRLSVQEDRILAATRFGKLERWDDEARKWQVVLDTSPMEPRWLLGPAQLKDGNAVVAQGRPPRGGAGRMLLYQAESKSAEATWPLPNGCIDLNVAPDGSVVAATITGPYLLSAKEALETGVNADDGEPLERLMNYFGVNRRADGFEPLTPEGIDLYSPVAQALTGDQHIIVYSRGELIRIPIQSPRAKAVTARQSVTLSEDNSSDQAPLMAVVDRTLLFVRPNEALQLFDAVSLEKKAEVEIGEWGDIRGIAVSPDRSQCVVLMWQGDVLLLDQAGLAKLSEGSQHTKRDGLPHVKFERANAVAWKDNHQFLVAHNTDSLDVLEASDGLKTIERIRPRLSGWRTLHRYVIDPIGNSIPRLGPTVQATILGDDRISLGELDDPDNRSIPLNPWRPLINCVVFTTLIIGIACFYFQRLDF